MAWSFRASTLSAACLTGHDYRCENSLLFSGAASGGGGGGAVTLTPWTIVNNTGGAMTNVPIEINVVFSESAGPYPFSAADCLQLLDADGVTIIPVQEDNSSSDRIGPDIRAKKLSAILPSLGSSATKQLTIQKLATTSPTSGTDATVSDINAIGDPLVLSMDHWDGTTYTASAASGLAAGSFTNKTTATNDGYWRSGGGFVTEWKVGCPFKNGGTAAPNNLYAWFTISVWKAQRGAVSVGNPIIGMRIQYRISSGWVQYGTSGVEAHWFDLTATSGSNVQSWVGSSPAKTLTLSGNGGNNTVVQATCSTSTFTQAMVGMVIDDGTGAALIIKLNSATSVDIRICSVMSGTSIASGAWRIYGINHEYSSLFPTQEIWYGGLAITAQPDIHSHLGVAWNAGTLTGGPFTYYRDCGMILPYTTDASAITNSMTYLNLCLPNPTGMGQGFAGDWAMYMPGTGPREEIAPMPGWDVKALIRFDSNAKPVIMGNASKLELCPVHYRNESTGKCGVPFNNGTDYNWNPDHGGNRLPRLSTYYYGTNPISDWSPQIAHHGAISYTRWLLTGDYFPVEDTQSWLFWLWSDCPTSYGTQLNRLFGNCSELRGNGWTHRDIMQGMLMTPDRSPSMLGYSRSDLATIWENHFTYTGSGTPNVNPTPGINLGLVNNTGVGKVYSAAGYRGMGQGGGGQVGQWQLGYCILTYAMCKGLGMVDDDAAAFQTWLMEGVTGAAVNANIAHNWVVSAYYLTLQEPDLTPVKDWYDVYRVTANELSQTGQNRRLVTGTGIATSGLSGAAITINMPSGYFNNGGLTFYHDGLVRDLNAASLQLAPLGTGTATPFDANAYNKTVGTSSNTDAIPTNAGTVKVWNTGSVNIYCKLSVGPGTATTGDTLITPGNYGKFTVGANTYLNYITASGTSSLTAFGSSGTGYANTNTITVSCSELSGKFSTTTAAVLTVSDVGVAGDVVAVTVSTPGLYIALSLNAQARQSDTQGATIAQASTSGIGTGFSVQCTDNVDYAEPSPFRYGTGFITAVNTGTHVVTVDTTASFTRYGAFYQGFPFAQTSLTTNKILAPAPAVGDANGAAGYSGNNALPQPYTGSDEIMGIAISACKMADVQGFTDGAAAYTNMAAIYTGSNEARWKVT